MKQLLEDFTVLDYETRDTYISRKMGGFGVYKILYGDICDSNIVGCGTYDNSRNKLEYIHGNNSLGYRFTGDVLVGHNLGYDLMAYLSAYCTGKDEAVAELRRMYVSGVTLIDTQILARLQDEFHLSYSLSSLTRHFKLSQKTAYKLADEVFNSGLYAEIKSTENRKFVNRPKDDKVLIKMAYSNMHRLSEEVVKEYCLDDVIATKELYLLLMSKLRNEYDDSELLELIQMYSTLQYVSAEMRLNGVTINNDKLHKTHSSLCKALADSNKDLEQMVGYKVNTASTASILPALYRAGYDDSQFTFSKTGKPSITQKWLEEQDNPVCKMIIKIRKLNKIISTFIESIMSIQDNLGLGTQQYGKIHPTFRIFGTHTGRYSCSDPNLQQIPKRDPEFGKMCRSLFVSGEGRTFVSADYSSQEQRIQVHYAELLGAEGANILAQAWRNNPKLDIHQYVADVVGLDRSTAKAISLGLAYGMGPGKLCRSLKLPVETKKVKFKDGVKEIEVAGPEGQDILDKYNTMMPFLKETITKVRSVMSERKYIRSIVGQHLHIEKIRVNGKSEDKDFKAFNQLIQSSAANQLHKCLVTYYELVCKSNVDIQIVGVVHDEVLFTIPNQNQSANIETIKDLMENAVKLTVPVIVEPSIGDSWYIEKG